MDLLLSRYSNMDFVMNLEVDDFIDLVEKAMEKKRDEDFFAVWRGLVPHMNQDNFISFEEYKGQLLSSQRRTKYVPPKEDKRTDEEILSDAEDILELLKVR